MQGCIQRVCSSATSTPPPCACSPPRAGRSTRRRQPRCCGALQLHAGVEDEALALARETIAAYEGYDTIVVNVAGCGSAMKDYGHLLADDPEWAERARRSPPRSATSTSCSPSTSRRPSATRSRSRSPTTTPATSPTPRASASRRASCCAAIPGLELLEPAEWELCCGSAGIYNLLQPEAAAKLGRRKADNLRATGAEAIAAANPGCALQIAAHLDGDGIRVYHPMTLLDRSLRGAPAGGILR